MPITYNVGCSENYKGYRDVGWSCLFTLWKGGIIFDP